MLRFNWMMYCCHRVSAQLRQYETIIIIIIKEINLRESILLLTEPRHIISTILFLFEMQPFVPD
jgi:hypothetical protein